MGKSGLTATGGTSLQGSTLQENSIQGSSLEGTPSALSGRGSVQGSSLEGSVRTDSLQRGTAGSASGTGGAQQRSGVRIFSRTEQGMDDDSYYRSHFSSTYGAGSESYDDYLPAYSYGSEMARSGSYAGRDWDEVETDLRTGWESRAGNRVEAAWDRMKAAVRRGWDRITSDDDDSYYRNHYQSTYASMGGTYDDYAPAYRYGSDMRRSSSYAGRRWDEVEDDLRTDWESRTGNKMEAAWDRMKAAVRRGWDRLTPDDDDDLYYRNHFQSTYGSTGASYDDYLPAYRYGSEMRRSSSYSGRNWDDVETDLRSGWESRTGDKIEAAWDRMKAAVRRGWDRITPDDDDDYYRSHFSSTYASTGKTFNDYAPAYSYGSEMARSDLYRNRPWDDVETDLRSDWETRRTASTSADASGHTTWENMKDAVKRGWERLTRDDDDDDEYYRTHWTSTYGTTGSSYDEYRPAYSYGAKMRSDPRYRDRQWDEVENDLRADWDTRYPGQVSTWEKMKAAVRHGWNRMTH